MHVSAVYAGARLAVIPPVFPLARLRALGRAQAVRVACRKLSTVNCRMVQIVVVAPGGESRALVSNDSCGERHVLQNRFTVAAVHDRRYFVDSRKNRRS